MPLGIVEQWRVEGGTVVLLVTVTEDERSEVEIGISFPFARSCQVRIEPRNAEAFGGGGWLDEKREVLEIETASYNCCWSRSTTTATRRSSGPWQILELDRRRPTT